MGYVGTCYPADCKYKLCFELIFLNQIITIVLLLLDVSEQVAQNRQTVKC
jgi:hypothetical protein